MTNRIMRTSATRKRQSLKYFFLALPFVVFIMAFYYVPLFGWGYSFVEYKAGFSLFDMEFVGLNNFKKLISDAPEILRVLRNTFAMSFLSIVVSPIPVVLAIMINDVRNPTFKRFIQTTTTLPNFISWVVVYGLAYAMFHSQGLVTTVMRNLGLPVNPIGVLGNNEWVWVIQLLFGMWKSCGWGAIIYIAAIAGIDMDQYDAAKVDGANRIKTIWHVTVPGIMPTYLVILLLNVSNMLNNGFEQIFVFYNSMVADRIENLDYFVYKIGIVVYDYSYSIAIGMLKTLVSVTLLFAVNWFSKRVRGDSLI